MSRRKSTGGIFKRHLTRLNDPKDTAAAWTFAGLLLAAEAVLCALIIWKVPCTSFGWVVAPRHHRLLGAVPQLSGTDEK
jgi:hypothetical protein